MPTLAPNQIPDLIASTLAELGEGKWTDISAALQEYLVVPMLTKQDRVVIQGGSSVQWDIITDENYSFTMTGLYDSDNVNVTNVLTQGNIPWRFSKAHYAFDVREPAMNEGPRQIVSLIKSRRHPAMMSIANGMELKFFRAPLSSSDTLEPYGMPYWIVKNNTTGFNGTVPAGHTAVGGVSHTTYPRWKNYTAQYAAVSEDDLVSKIRTAMSLTGFKPPVASATFNTGDKYMMFSTLAVKQGLEQLAKAQNENIGIDLDPYNDAVLIRKVRLVWAPMLDQSSSPDTTNPVYGVNFGEFKTVVNKNWWMKEIVIDRMPGQHNVSAVFIDSQWNWICRNRRRNFVIATDTTMPA